MKGPSSQLLSGCISFHLCTIHHALCTINGLTITVLRAQVVQGQGGLLWSVRYCQQPMADRKCCQVGRRSIDTWKRNSSCLVVENLYIFRGKYAMQLRNM